MTLSPRLALLLTLPPILWAGNAVVGRMVVDSISPLLFNGLRWVGAALILWPLGGEVLRRARGRQQIRERAPWLALLGLVGVGAYNALQYAALHTSTPLNVTLVAFSSPVWMLLIGAVAFGVRPRGRDLLGAALSLAGVAVVLSRGDAAALREVRFVPGDLMMLVAIASWATYSWMLARPPAAMQGTQAPGWDWAQFLMAQVVFGLGWAGLAAGIEAAAMPGGPVFVPSLTLALALLYVAVGPSLIAYRCWGAGVAQAGPAVASFFSNLTPLFAALMSAALLGEAPRPYHAVAFALIVAGIAVSARRGG